MHPPGGKARGHKRGGEGPFRALGIRPLQGTSAPIISHVSAFRGGLVYALPCTVRPETAAMPSRPRLADPAAGAKLPSQSGKKLNEQEPVGFRRERERQREVLSEKVALCCHCSLNGIQGPHCSSSVHRKTGAVGRPRAQQPLSSKGWSATVPVPQSSGQASHPPGASVSCSEKPE